MERESAGDVRRAAPRKELNCGEHSVPTRHRPSLAGATALHVLNGTARRAFAVLGQRGGITAARLADQPSPAVLRTAPRSNDMRHADSVYFNRIADDCRTVLGSGLTRVRGLQCSGKGCWHDGDDWHN